MKSAEEWFDILWKRVNHPTYGGKTLMDIIGKIQREAAKEMRLRFQDAINATCSCGGKGPDDDGVCPACQVWHRALPLPGDDHDQT